MPRSIRYEDFALKIASDGAGGCTVRVLHAPYGGRDTPLVLPYDDVQLDQIMGTLEALVRGSSRHGRPTARTLSENSDPEEVGADLFRAVFQDSILESYLQSLGRVESDPKMGLRVRLHFDPEEPELRRLCTLPWELLYRGSTRDFLARDVYTPVLRYLHVPRYQGTLSPVAELRILAVMASPEGVTPLNLKQERERLEEAIGDHPRIDLQFLESPTLNALRHRLRDEEFHGLHFMGHGDFDHRTGDGALLFETPEGTKDPVLGRVLADTLTAAPSLRLVFLNACDTARLPRHHGQDPYTGVASALVMRGIPAVLAMQFPISDIAAIAFSEAFYGALGAGDPVEGALAEGRHAIYRDQPQGWEWATPVLFLGVDGALFPQPEETPIHSLAELDGVDSKTRREILKRYEEQVKEQPENAKYHLAVGLLYLDMKLYDQAIAALEKALERAPGDGDVLYYLALASVRGRRLRALRLSEVRRIESLLDASSRDKTDKATPLLLMAFLKSDFYRTNGIRLIPPTAEDLLGAALKKEVCSAEIRKMFQHAPSASGESLLRMFNEKNRGAR